MILPTPRQKQLLDFIISYRDTKGANPSYVEMAAALKMKSISSAHAMVTRLVDRGHLNRTVPGLPRSLEVIRE